MKKISLYIGVFSLISSAVYAGDSTPKTPTQVPAATAQAYINNYKIATLNFFAHGYLLDVASTAAMSTSGVRLYNGLVGENQKIVLTPLNSNFEVSNGPCYMQSDRRLCPKFCDVVQVGSMEAPERVSSEEVTSSVNYCIDCRKYETVNALNIFTKTLNSLSGAGFKYVRIYNGMDEENRRYVVYIPVDATGKEVALDQVYVGDNTSVMVNCKYPK